MANAIFAWPNWMVSTITTSPAIVSAGAWTASSPAANVFTRFLGQVARSSTAAASATVMKVDLGATRGVKVFAIPKSNISSDGQIRLTGYSDAAFSAVVASTGFVDYWADAYEWGSRVWGSPDLFNPKFSAEEVDGYPSVYYKVFSEPQVARYWKLEVSNTSNEDGYIDISRLVFSPGWQSSINIAPGAELGWKTDTLSRKSRGGVKYFDKRPTYRRGAFTIELLDMAEALANPFEMGRKMSLDGEVFFIFDPDDTTHALRRAFLANMEQLSPITFPVETEYVSVPIFIEEVVG